MNLKKVYQALLIIMASMSVLSACKRKEKAKDVVKTIVVTEKKKAICCESNIPGRFKQASLVGAVMAGPDTSHDQMVWIPAGTFRMGADNKQAENDEYPKHKVTVDGFWIDRTEVTNAQFEQFVKATGYITTAEQNLIGRYLRNKCLPEPKNPLIAYL